MIVFETVEAVYWCLFVINCEFLLELDEGEVCCIFEAVLEIVALHQVIKIEPILFEGGQWKLLPEGTHRAVGHGYAADDAEQDEGE